MPTYRFRPIVGVLLFVLVSAVRPPTVGAQPGGSDPADASRAQAQPALPGSDVSQSGPLTRADIEALRARGEAEGWTFTVGYNPATDRSLDELCGLKIPPGWQPPAARVAGAPARDLPAAFDWRILRGTTSIKDQGACGSCWAFSGVAPIEAAILIKEGVEEDLSEQWLNSCTTAGSCSGGWHDEALYQMSCEAEGAVLEADFPYEAADVPCGGPYDHPYCISDYFYVGTEYLEDVPYLKQAILDYGPISITVAVDTPFQAYTGGVFNACAGTSLNHAVALVGWDDNQGANGVWIMRNSWGPYWGEYGYMRIEYGCNRVGYAAYAVQYSPEDCNHNGTLDGLELLQCPGGETWCADCNGNWLLDVCERDCNENGIPDDCDIESGFSTDANVDFLPDECGTDCNGNGQFDFYELLGDLYADIDRDHVPDECQDCDDDGVWDWEDAGRPDGLLIVSAGNNRVRSFYPEVGSPVGSFGVGHLSNPYDVTVGPDQSVYVSSRGDNRVVKFDARGNYVGDLNSCGTHPTGLAFGPDGLLYIGSRNTSSVYCYNTTSDTCLGACVASGASGLLLPYGLIFSSNGHLFVASAGDDSVKEYAHDGSAWQFVRPYANAALSGPRGLAFHPSGDLLVASTNNARILRFGVPSTAYLGVFASLSSGPGAVQGIAYGPDGYLYVVTYSGVLRVYMLNGQTGREWRTFNRADPDLNTPAGLTFYPPSRTDCNHNYLPDNCDSLPDCNGNAIADMCELEGNDCNGSGVPDDCELSGNDCNTSGVPDECEVPPIDPGAPDCNVNGTPDECDADGNGNGIPDDCECAPTDAPLAEQPAVLKGRYLSFRPANTGVRTALRVTVMNVPEPYAGLEGKTLWLGPPQEVCENSGQRVPPPEGCGPAPGIDSRTLWVAKLRCDPYFTDWGAMAVVYAYHEAVMPGGAYVIQAFDEGCDSGAETDYSDPLAVSTAGWADSVSDCTGCPCGPPDGMVNITTDCTAMVDKFKNLHCALEKARCDLEPAEPDQRINIADLTYCIGAFIGLDYPFTPDTDPCGP